MTSPRKPPHWIPPAGLCAGYTAHGASWMLLLALAARGTISIGFPLLAWLHVAVLGWLTMIALSILIHVIPAFTDVPWKAGQLARAALAPYAIGVVALVTAFMNGSVQALPWAGALVVLSLCAYLVPAWRTLAAARHAPRERAIARALSVTLASLLITALLGLGLTWALDGRAPASLLSLVPPIHASFGLIGWLTVLVMGVSVRTVRPITGVTSRFAPASHIGSGSSQLLGMLALIAGSASGITALTWIGFLAIALGSLLYVGDVFDIVRRSTVTHRPPQAFLIAASGWLIVALALGGGALTGAAWGTAAVYVFVIGWIGQMVNGHLYHIGIRLIATMARGEDDETRPGVLLSAALSWTSFAFFQTAVASGAAAFLSNDAPLLVATAICGLAGWATMLANIAVAYRRAREGA